MIAPEQFVVEVRSLALGRLGQIDTVDLVDLKIIKRLNNVGAWSLSLPAEHEMALELSQPGRGIIVNGPAGLVTSGPMTSAELVQDPDDLSGTYYYSGVDDNVFLADALVFPQPSNTDPGTQTSSHWTMGPTDAEDVLRQVFSLNIGPSAQASRKPNTSLHLNADTNLGAIVTVKSRFDKLGEFMAGVASYANLAFDLKQDATGIGLYISQPTNRAATIRMDLANDLLDKVSRGIGAPSGTRYVVAGQGEGTERQIIQVTDATAASAEAAWGRKIEVWKDRRDTNDTTILTQEGTEGIGKTGRTVTSLSVIPSNDTTMVYGVDWFLGDIVTVVIDSQELPTQVTEAIIAIDADGVTVAATVGNPSGFDYESKLIQQQQQAEERLSFLEKNSETQAQDVIDANIVSLIEDRVARGVVAASWTAGPVPITLQDGTPITAKAPTSGFIIRPGDDVAVLMTSAGYWVVVAAFSTAGNGPLTPIFVPLPRLSSIRAWDPANWQLRHPYSLQANIEPLFGSPWAVTRNSSGVVTFVGLGSSSSAISAGATIATLPVGFRPAVKMRFTGNVAGGRQAFDVNTNGTITTLTAIAINSYISLSSIVFHEASYANAMTWTAPTLLNSFANDANFGTVEYAQDAYGDVWVRGVVTRGSAWSDGLPIFQLPAGLRPTMEQHYNGYTDSGFGYAGGSKTTGNVTAKVGSAGATRLSLCQVLIQPASLDASMLTLSQSYGGAPAFINSWTHYDANNYTPGSYRRRGDGLVLVRGLIRSGTTAVIHYLPQGLRPAADIIIERPANGAYARYDISADDKNAVLSQVAGSNAWSSMDGMAWQAAR